ncbi:adenylate/guanylate cyclase domain-containing protein [Sulfitobacter pseudonitzschiae]|nr:adenylate/guanylate cyclase domain-containing protein [Pseudosulfitobacter pseudonitzschiae]MBM1932024.1 adenylate/guanylate cyclase domain-containing protein [Pseudosulfitobacter pseudonitzschiae]MBM2193148.1 adenylate/guanylate cyclase domain-containing protein [Pseudosulfitobacter pseudonitzschiae]MBM2265790.1 adenylate/guanylate cyclase domain-containing protein [Pseudosulfitobacter pseudonitzschiae]UFE45455.1 adenylate/guanylate cyclase domain-containing protein [Pseudosulfitobacter pse
MKKKMRNWEELDADGRGRHRFDFVIQVLSTDDETQTARIQLKPDPRRYTTTTENGRRSYLDRFLKILIPEEIVHEMMCQHLIGLPISYDPPSIQSASDYANSRRMVLTEETTGGSYIPPSETSQIQKGLFAGSSADFVSFISVDIVGSTSLRQEFGERFDKSYKYFLRELITSVGHFKGSVLNVTGDGFIAYIDLPGFTTQCDNTVDLGLTLLHVLKESINPALKQADLPTLKVRIGADVGKAHKRSVDVPTTNFRSFDIGSSALNRAVKIEQMAGEDQFLIGQALYELLHVGWLERCEVVPLDGRSLGALDYEVYRIS